MIRTARACALAWAALGSAQSCEETGDCQADEAGLLQVVNSGNDRSVPSYVDASPELVQAMAKVQNSADASEAIALMPENLRAVMKGLAELPSTESQGPSPDACVFTKKSDCGVDTLKTTGFTSIKPSKRWGTACLNTKMPEYAFQVYPGSSSKLMIYFQDGGACWDPLSATLPNGGSKGACTQEVWETGPVGVFNKADDENPYKDFTFIHINYCSGDAHAGDNVHPWGRQAGYNNSNAAITWALQNFGSKKLDQLMIGGASAGALGTQIWSRTLLKEFKYSKAEVVIDSYLGIFPDNTQSYFLDKVFNTCSTPLGQGWSKSCGDDLTVQDAVDEAIGMYPEVPFIFINSKGDSVQSMFFSAIALTVQKRVAILDARFLYTAATKILAVYDKNPNFLVFQVDGDEHMFLPRERCKDASDNSCAGDMYSATPEGPLAAFDGKTETLCSWLAQSAKSAGNTVVTNKCHGIPSALPYFLPFPTTHCDKAFGTKKVKFVKGLVSK